MKDPFPVLKLDQLVDATYGHPRISFLDAFQGHHQIALAPKNQKKTFFILPKRNYHYTVMPFGLKNTRAMCQGIVTRMFKDQIGDTMEVYINDMLVKGRKSEEHGPNLVEAFEILRQHKLCLNAGK